MLTCAFRTMYKHSQYIVRLVLVIIGIFHQGVTAIQTPHYEYAFLVPRVKTGLLLPTLRTRVYVSTCTTHKKPQRQMLDIVAFTNHIIHNSQFCNNGRDYAFYDWVELVETASACG